MPERRDGREFVDALRRAAEVVDAGPAPVEEVIRRGRALRARRRTAVLAGAGAAGVLAVVLATGPVWWSGDQGPTGGAGPDGGATPTATAQEPPPEGAGGGPPVEVGPYEPVVINDQYVLGLLPEGKQNYVVSSPEHFEENVETSKGHFGSNIRPDTISAGYTSELGRTVLIDGVWRLDGLPSRIEIVPDGTTRSYPAHLITLAGEPGWGAYYLDVASLPGPWQSFRVLAYDASGTVFDEMTVDLSIAPPPG